MKALVVGWFSMPNPHATVGDVMAAGVVGDWLASAGIEYDILVASPLESAIQIDHLHPHVYTHVVVVCGPYMVPGVMRSIPGDFSHCRRIGIDLSIVAQYERAQAEFDALFERDGPGGSRPELAFISRFKPVPVVGLLLVHPQPEYGTRALHTVANEQVLGFISKQQCAVVNIDTLLTQNPTGFRSASEVESIIARMECVITTRLHGMVLALKHGVPALTIDPIAGGAKVTAQCKEVGWPTFVTADQVTQEVLSSGFTYCLSQEGRLNAKACAERASRLLEQVRIEFIHSL